MTWSDIWPSTVFRLEVIKMTNLWDHYLTSGFVNRHKLYNWCRHAHWDHDSMTVQVDIPSPCWRSGRNAEDPRRYRPPSSRTDRPRRSRGRRAPTAELPPAGQRLSQTTAPPNLDECSNPYMTYQSPPPHKGATAVTYGPWTDTLAPWGHPPLPTNPA